MPGPLPKTLSILGLGAAGSALARGLARKGWHLQLWNRDGAKALALAAELQHATAYELPQAAAGASPHMLLAVTDGALGSLATMLAEHLGTQAFPTIALHASGMRGPEVLQPLREQGVFLGSLHPLAAMPAGNPLAYERLVGAGFAIAGEARACHLAFALAEALGGFAFELPGDPEHPERMGEVRARYHAGAFLVAGGIVALIEAASRQIQGGSSELQRAFTALAQSVLHNLAGQSAGAAMTGPVARGDADQVAAHLVALGRDEPAADLYRALSRVLVELGEAHGRLGEDACLALRQALRAGPPLE